MALTLQPELSLPKELNLSYPPEIFEWVKSNLPGLRYITFKEVIRRNDYKPQCCRITVNSSATPSSIPEEKPNEICEKIYSVLQYFRDAEDKEVKFCVTLYNKTNTGTDKPSAKHIDVGSDGTGEWESKFFNPNKVDGDLVDQQARYIAQIHDHNCSLMSMVVGVVAQQMESNKEKDKTIRELGGHQVQLKHMEYTSEAEKEEQKIRYMLEQARIKANNEKLESVLKHLNKDGALTHLIQKGASKFFGAISGNEEIKKPQPKKKVVIKTPEQTSADQKTRERQKEEEDLRVLDEGLRVSPIFTQCVLLKDSLTFDELENGNDSVNVYMRENLSVGMLKDFQDLLTSENEEDAKDNLRTLFSNLSDDDYPKLMMLRTKMNEGQQKIITSLYNFLAQENKDESEE